MKLQNKCPKCNRPLELVAEVKMGTSLTYQPLKSYKCGHIFVEDLIEKIPIKFLDAIGNDKTARPYQVDFLDFFLNGECNMNALLSDEMGIGKTAQALLALRNNRKNLTPCLIIVKSSITFQWLNEGRIWFDNNILSNYIITNTKGFIPPGFLNYIISMDTFSRMVKFESQLVETEKDQWGNSYTKRMDVPIISPPLAALGIKFIIADECQSYKNPSSMRTKALIGFIKAANIKHKLFLSGTPIENRADEYFTVLNLLMPEKITSLDRFQSNWCMRDSSGRYSRIATYLEKDFREMISPYVLRREKKDVQIDLPDFQRDFQIINVDNDKMKEIYNLELDRLREIMLSKGGNPSYVEISDSLMTLRRITGMMKVEWAVDEIEDFLESCEGEKIAVGVHHHMVRDGLFGLLKARGHNVLKLSGDDDSSAKERIKKEFGHPDNRILIINMLAGGVGMDGLQICNNVLVLERQWNSTKEEQFEGRFWRSGQILKVMAKYPLVKGTVDELFAAMVESKRYMFGKTVGNDWDSMGEPLNWKDLVNDTIGRRLV